MSAFDQLAAKLAAQGAKNPRAMAYSIGANKYGKATMNEAASKRESVQTVLRKRRRGKR